MEEDLIEELKLLGWHDSDRDVIKRTVHELKDKGHVIEILYWGKQGKMKVHGKQFRRALLREYGEGGMNK